MILSASTLLLLGLGLGIGYAFSFYDWFYTTIYPEVPRQIFIEPYKLGQASYYYDNDDNEIYREYHNENRTIIKYEEIPPQLINAIVAIEDREYFEHSGISYRGIARALYNNYLLKQGYLEGGSTITQQLAKNLFLSPEKTIERKLKEMLYAYRIEKQYLKEEILEFYLNTVPFGGTAYGIEAAAQQFFHKTTKELSLAEASFLAGLPAAPTEYSPYNSEEIAKERQKQVLYAMQAMGFIDWHTVREAYWTKLPIYAPVATITHPHFIFYTQQYVADLLGEEVLQKGGLKIYTTIDANLQSLAQDATSNTLPELRQYHISNAAALITENDSGAIRAMVGSKNYYAQDIDGFVNLTTAFRQPGSAIKPINYTLFLENGNTLSTLIKDAQISYPQANGEKYEPVNYDNKFRGDVTVRRALANSLNIPSVKALEQNGIEEFASLAVKFGLDPWPPETWGLALALGSAEIRMVKMNEAYSVFPNHGRRIRVTPIRYILDSNNNLLYFNSCLYLKESFPKLALLVEQSCSHQIIHQETAFLITSVLTDQKTRKEAFGTENELNIDGVAAKTGTTNELRDNWTFGFNKQYTVGAWVGNNDNSPMTEFASGLTGAATVWHKLIVAVTNEENKIILDDWQPETIKKVKVCAPRNTLPCQSCNTGEEYYIDKTQPTLYCLDPKPPEGEKKEEEKD